MRQPYLPNDCFSPTAGLMRHQVAIDLLKARISPICEVEPVDLASSAGRIVADTIQAPHDVPLHTNAAVDGYAFAARDYDRDLGANLRVGGRAAAGHPFEGTAASGAAVRILTGAVLPDGLDTVAMQEDCDVSETEGESFVRIPARLKPGANVRHAGEDLRSGQALFESGHILRPQDLAALASVGVGTVTCHRRLRVGIVSSGDEVIRAGDRALEPGEVYDANAPMLSTLVELTGAETVDLGVWPDSREDVIARLGEASKSCDVIVTSGGASLGEEDHMSAALASLGSRHFWRIAVKPGRPMMFGQTGPAIMVGLPGNPVAVFVCFLMYVYPMLRRLSGAQWPSPRRYLLPAAFDFPNRKLGRREFWRATFNDSADGGRVEKFARDGSGLISGLRAADGLIEVDEETPAIVRGDLVSYIPFTEFGILAR
ncbi:MAG: molybdopterin molybdotransferase MoeA [Alphaproteobacteria bacterium]|nr:molybdopterin molybdotransferase MoeA [Alphaproteobacteria bacterium]